MAWHTHRRVLWDTTPETPIDGYGDTVTLGVRPGNGVAALFLPCERSSHRHTAVVTRPRLSLVLELLEAAVLAAGHRRLS